MFKSPMEFSLHIEQLKQQQKFETYMETILFFYENYSDQEMSDIAKMLSKKIINELEKEAVVSGLIKPNEHIDITTFF